MELEEAGAPDNPMPFVWYAVMLNHSFVHHWFTYRGLAASVFAVVGIGVMCGDAERIV